MSQPAWEMAPDMGSACLGMVAEAVGLHQSIEQLKRTSLQGVDSALLHETGVHEGHVTEAVRIFLAAADRLTLLRHESRQALGKQARLTILDTAEGDAELSAVSAFVTKLPFSDKPSPDRIAASPSLRPYETLEGQIRGFDIRPQWGGAIVLRRGRTVTHIQGLVNPSSGSHHVGLEVLPANKLSLNGRCSLSEAY